MIRGTKTIIRKFTQKDVDKMQAWEKFTDELYTRFNFLKMSKKESDEWYNKVKRKKHLLYAIDDLNGFMIGYIALGKIDQENKSAHLQIVLSADKVSQGYGTDALKTFLEYSFKVLKFNKILLEVSLANERAIKLYRKMGFDITKEYYREDTSGIKVFKEKKFTDIRKYFKKEGNKLYVKFYEMELRKEDFIEGRMEMNFEKVRNNKLEIKIRRAKESDLTEILELLKQLHPKDKPLTLKESKNIFAQLTKNNNYYLLVAEINNKIVGTLYLVIIPNLTRGARHWAQIENIIVDEKWRRKEIGRKLIEYAVNLAKKNNCYKFFLTSNIKREDAHKFYKSVGFCKHGYSFRIDL